MPIWSPGRHIPTQKIPKCLPRGGPLWINRVKLLTLYMYHTLFSGYHFIWLLFHHPLTCTSQRVWMWISAHSHRGKGMNTKLPYFHLPSCKSVGWICWNYRWECSLCRVRVRVTHRSWSTWSSSWRNVAGSSRRMIREKTEFPLDAILKGGDLVRLVRLDPSEWDKAVSLN